MITSTRAANNTKQPQKGLRESLEKIHDGFDESPGLPRGHHDCAADHLFGEMASVAKELLVARRFGTDATIEAFLVAVLIPMLAINVISSSFSIALIPTYITVRERDGKEVAQRLLSGKTGEVAFQRVRKNA